jgi:nitrate reductase NapE component
MKAANSSHKAPPVHFLAIAAGMFFIFGIAVPGAVLLVNWVAHLVLGT